MDDGQPTGAEASLDADEADAVCALEGCGNPLPPPVIDEHGRRKGGRPSRYCSKAHTDAASRARRIRDSAAVSDPLSEVRSIGATLLPSVRELANSLTALEQRFTEAEQQAFAQVAHAEAETSRAREDAADAVTRAEQAERARREALAQSRDHQREQERARKDADWIRREAEEARSQAWDAVAVHERARGQAEAAHAAVTAERDRLATELRAAHTQMEHERAEQARLTSALTAAQAGLADTCRELNQLREESAHTRSQLGTLKDRLRTEQEQRHRSQAQAREREIELRSTRERLAEANARVDTLIEAGIVASPEPSQPTTLPLDSSSSGHPIWLGHPAPRPATGRH